MPSSHPAQTTKSRITVLISGAGTNLQALITACNDSRIRDASIVRVVSNRRAAYGLTRAREAGIPTRVHALAEYKQRFADPGPDGRHAAAREAYDADLVELVLQDRPDLIVLAGFMHVLSAACLERLSAKGIVMINLHPALAGKFNGA